MTALAGVFSSWFKPAVLKKKTALQPAAILFSDKTGKQQLLLSMQTQKQSPL